MLVASSWDHTATATTTEMQQEKERDINASKNKTGYKLVMYDVENRRVRRKVCHLPVPLPPHLFYTYGGMPSETTSNGKPCEEYVISASKCKLISWSVLNKCGSRVVCPEVSLKLKPRILFSNLNALESDH